MGTSTIVVESPYIDRHYIEEYSHYYATTLKAPTHTTSRLHFFSTNFTDTQFDAWITEAKSGDGEYQAVRQRLQSSYLGFIVIRPLPSAPIGRTILKPYSSEYAARYYDPATIKHRVHLLGFELEIRGVPFQQQDQGVGACATTALWSALACVTRANGGRAPTPFAVTEAATKYLLSDRVYPAKSGLSLEQMTAAIRAFGFSPHVLKPKAEAAFWLAIKCYVRSGIPVVLVSHAGGGQHAVTVVGFREARNSEITSNLEIDLQKSFTLKAHGLSRLYLHDDRIGPYMRMRLMPPQEDSGPLLSSVPDQDVNTSNDEPAEIWYAIAPLYTKLRLSAVDLIDIAVALLPLLRRLAGDRRDELYVDLRYELGGHYLKSLYCSDLSAVRLNSLVRSVMLSRYVGVIRFYLNGKEFVDFVCDTTDIIRSVPGLANVLALIAYREELVKEIKIYAKQVCPQATVV